MSKKFQFEKQIAKLPKEVIWCKKCVMSNQRPRINFGEDGICSGCKNNEHKNNVDWAEREKELNELLNEHRKSDGSFDVIVPSSGGKDSGYVAHLLKYKYNMNPLTVTWSPLEYTEIGKKNFYSLVNKGLSNILITPNGELQRKMARLCLEELGDAFHVFVLGQISIPFQIAIKYNVKLVFYGENGELEYAGDTELADKPFKPSKFWANHHFKGSSINELIDYARINKKYFKNFKINKADLNLYNCPSEDELEHAGIKGKHFFSYYKKWIPQENYYYCVENINFKANPERNEGTFSRYASLDDKMDGMHYYMRYIKLGLGRCSEDAAHEIRDGHITRDDGIALMKKYEGEFPNKYYSDFLNYLDITNDEFLEISDSWRLDHIWEKRDNKWILKNPIF